MPTPVYFDNQCSGSEIAGISFLMAVGLASIAAAWTAFVWIQSQTKSEESKQRTIVARRVQVTIWVLIVMLALFGAALAAGGTLKYFEQCHTITATTLVVDTK